jgi:hypothetical protein
MGTTILAICIIVAIIYCFIPSRSGKLALIGASAGIIYYGIILLVAIAIIKWSFDYLFG